MKLNNLFKIPDLKKRLLFTLGMLVVVRLGSHLPLPGIDKEAMANLFAQGGILGFFDLFAGGALSRFSVFAFGNGISIIIFAGIVARIPTQLVQTAKLFQVGEIGILPMVTLIIVSILVVGGVIAIQKGQRRIPVQYAKRVIGRRMYGGQGTHIPLRVNQAGVIPIIFASAILILSDTIAQFFQNLPFMKSMSDALSPGQPLYLISYTILIILFTFFYTAITFNPANMADNMKKYGGFIPGIRPGKNTTVYIDHIMTRITLSGALFLAVIAILPNILIKITGITTFYFGGTSLLIMV